jgi:ATP-dependent helicase/nuclease subunit A
MANLTSHQKAALDISKHISLTANAGSGKTFVLSMRYLEIAIQEDIPLRNIAAITFTDKAAGELYTKIVKQVDEKIAASVDPQLTRKLENIRRQLVSANISTIHSFCINILREYPVEAELDANFVPVDERTSGELIELSVENVIKSALENPETAEDIKYLIRIYTSRNLFAADLANMIRNRKNILALKDKIYNRDEAEIASGFFDSFIHLFRLMFPFDKESLIGYLEEINNTVLAGKKENQRASDILLLINKLRASDDTSEIITLLGEINKNICTKTGTVYSQGYLGKKLREGLETSCTFIEDFFKGFPKTQLLNHQNVEYELAVFGKKILFFFEAALNEYAERKREGGYLDYEDILLYAQKILENDYVRQELSEKFKYIMIDEYQDTNELQYRIFLPILDYLRKGNLFVVGDEKQSIYMFRDAELEIFSRTKNDIKEDDPANKLLKLPDSFRMSANLCLFTNYIFRNLFRNPVPAYNEVEHSDLVCARSTDITGSVEILIAGNEDEKNENAEPELISARISKLVSEQGIKFSDIAILCRKRKSFSILEKVLSDYNIPFSIMGGKGFYQRQFVYDICNYFSFLLDRNNDTALVGILRSPFFSVSDTEIFEISLQKGKSFWQKIKNYAENDGKHTDVVNNLSGILSLSSTLDIVSLLRKILFESDYLAVIASKPDGSQEIANINKLVNLTINFNARGFNTLYDYIDFLIDSIESTEDEAQAAVSDDSDSVKIMTYHQAKGLEFPAVFLFKCDETSRVTVSKSKSVTVSKDYGLLTKVPVNQDFFGEYKAAPLIELSNLLNNKKSNAELKRLFYVGVTRAKDYLFLSMEKKKNYPAGTFSAMLFEGLKQIPVQDKIVINSDLEFLASGDNGFYNKTENIRLEIPVVTEIEGNTGIPEKVNEEYNVKKLLIQTVHDVPEGEIISATKVAVYMQCPLKYKLTYELGYLPLFTGYKNNLRDRKNRSYEFSNSEDESLLHTESGSGNNIKSLSGVKGSVIHRALQMEADIENIESFITSEVKNRIGVFEYESMAPELITGAIQDLKQYYNSAIYRDLKNYKNFKNEFEIYVKEKDYYLYGIIDKLIVEGDRVIIADYKTDDISAEEIHERAEIYFNQLRFYSYIVNRFLENINTFELRLIFLKHPGKPVIQVINKDRMAEIGQDIDTMVKNIREGNFNRNTGHCTKCNYSLKFNRCIINDNH